MLASIRKSGKGGLRKVPESEKRVREAPLAGGSSSAGGSAASAATAANPMMALQDALNKRKKVVASNSGESRRPLFLCIPSGSGGVLIVVAVM